MAAVDLGGSVRLRNICRDHRKNNLVTEISVLIWGMDFATRSGGQYGFQRVSVHNNNNNNNKQQQTNPIRTIRDWSISRYLNYTTKVLGGREEEGVRSRWRPREGHSDGEGGGDDQGNRCRDNTVKLQRKQPTQREPEVVVDGW